MTTSRDAPLSHQLLLFAAVWGAIVLFMGVVNVGTRFAVEGGGALAYVGVLLWAWLIGLVVYPSAMAAALLRGLWLRFAPASVLRRKDRNEPVVPVRSYVGVPAPWTSRSRRKSR